MIKTGWWRNIICMLCSKVFWWLSTININSLWIVETMSVYFLFQQTKLRKIIENNDQKKKSRTTQYVQYWAINTKCCKTNIQFESISDWFRIVHGSADSFAIIVYLNKAVRMAWMRRKRSNEMIWNEANSHEYEKSVAIQFIIKSS